MNSRGLKIRYEIVKRYSKEIILKRHHLFVMVALTVMLAIGFNNTVLAGENCCSKNGKAPSAQCGKVCKDKAPCMKDCKDKGQCSTECKDKGKCAKDCKEKANCADSCKRACTKK